MVSCQQVCAGFIASVLAGLATPRPCDSCKLSAQAVCAAVAARMSFRSPPSCCTAASLSVFPARNLASASPRASPPRPPLCTLLPLCLPVVQTF